MGLLVLAAITGYLAFRIGKWRHSCIFWELKAPFNLPSGWRNPTVKLGTWVAVTLLSLTFATALAALISQEVGSFAGKFSWGVLLWARWFASRVAAFIDSTKEMEKIEREAGIS